MPVRQPDRDDPTADPALDQQVDHVVLVEEADALLDALLVQRLQDHVACAVGRVAGPPDWSLAEVAGVPPEPPLVDPPVLGPVERQPQVLEFDHRFDRLARQDFRGVLVDEVVAPLHGVEHVPLPVVFLLVAQGRADSALRGTCVGAGRVELGQDRRRHALSGKLERRVQAGATRADDERVELVDDRFIHHVTPPPAMSSQPLYRRRKG